MELGDDVHKAHKSCSLVVIYVLLFSWFMHWGMFILSLLQSWWLPAFGHEDVSDGQFGHISMLCWQGHRQLGSRAGGAMSKK